MDESGIHAVTGAFGFSGRCIATRLVAQGRSVITLTGSPDKPNPFGDKLKVYPFNFDKPEELAESLKGVRVLYNTYWVRFNYKTFTHARAVENSLTLFRAAREAGVERIVHFSITNPSKDSPIEYFRRKAELEEAVKEIFPSYAILRPALIFGPDDTLINNIAWNLRRFPVFPLFGRGNYRVQPIFVEDLAAIAIREGQQRYNVTLDCIGPESPTYRAFIKQIASAIGKKRLICPAPKLLAYLGTKIIGKMLGDIVVTRDEMKTLKGELLHVDSPPVGTTKLSEWLNQNAYSLGRTYHSELKKRRRKM